MGEWRKATDIITEKKSKTMAVRLAKCWLEFLNPETQQVQGGYESVEKEVEELFNDKDKVVPKI